MPQFVILGESFPTHPPEKPHVAKAGYRPTQSLPCPELLKGSDFLCELSFVAAKGTQL